MVLVWLAKKRVKLVSVVKSYGTVGIINESMKNSMIWLIKKE